MSVHVALAAQRLNWSHFRKLQASPVAGKVAQTATSIQPTRIRTRTTDEGAQISQIVVELRLDAPECWVVKGAQTTPLLEHERLHYRIAILLAHELETTLLALRVPTVADLTGASNGVLQAESERSRAIDDAYDLDTGGGQDIDEQRHWVVRVQGWEANRQIDF